MKSPTKLELTQINSRLAAENAALRAKNSELTGRINIVEAQNANLRTQIIIAANPRQLEAASRKVAMDKARAQAIASGRMVKFVANEVRS